jgi:prophage regulatory protein
MKIIKLPAVMQKVSMGRTQIYQRMKDGTFPLSVPQGKRGRGWIEEEIESWIEARIAARDAEDAADRAARAARGPAKATARKRGGTTTTSSP